MFSTHFYVLYILRKCMFSFLLFYLLCMRSTSLFSGFRSLWISHWIMHVLFACLHLYLMLLFNIIYSAQFLLIPSLYLEYHLSSLLSFVYFVMAFTVVKSASLKVFHFEFQFKYFMFLTVNAHVCKWNQCGVWGKKAMIY